MRQKSALLHALISMHIFGSGTSQHPCTDEVASACADRPQDEIGSCLSDPQEHDQETTISSACTDFIALNKACSEDIESFCDGGQFTDDVVLCLSKWTDRDNLSPKCQNVLKWAVVEEETDDDPVTDELGMSEKDYAEKKAWQAKRKGARTAAIEKLASDKKREEEQKALEEWKTNDPEGYEQMLQQQEEEKRQKEEFAKLERARAAAFERQKRKDAGLPEEEDPTESKSSGGKSKSKSKTKKDSSSNSWVPLLASLAVLGIIGVVITMMVKKLTPEEKTSSKKTKKTKTK